jgi:dipeptidyl aminopeptidase/acylaminoacyl peptidase
VQGDYGVATRRVRLVLIDIRTGTVRRPAPEADVLANFLSWSADGAELLAFVRDDGAPWSAGRLVRIDAARGDLRPIGRDIRPAVERRPEVVYGGWWGRDPIVFGRAAAGGRLDWYRLAPNGPIRLTGELETPPRQGLVISRRQILLGADGGAWRIGRDGKAHRLRAAFKALPRRTQGLPPRPAFAPRQGTAILGTIEASTGAVIGALGADGRFRDPVALPARSNVLAYIPARGVAVDRLSGGGREDLEWRGLEGKTTPLATINARFAEIDTPRAVAVAHTGPNGEALRSWVLLPAGAANAAAPPLIVVPYLGATYGESPAISVNRAPPFDPTGALVGHGYAVLVPSLPVRRGGTGPADRLAEQVLAIVDAASKQPDLAQAFDPNRLGLWGHSFGGYSALAILTQTDRFRAAVAQAAVSNLISQAGVFAPGRRSYADEGVSTPWQTGWVESLQGNMRGPVWAQTDRYIRNSPVLQADRITTPVMIVHGDQDFMALGQAEEMFSALYRQNKDAQLVTYWGEGHQYASPGTLRDLHARIFDWFDGHLRPPPP